MIRFPLGKAEALLAEGKRMVPGLPIPVVVFAVHGQLVAFDSRCPHRSGPIGDGAFDGASVTCPWHQARFTLPSGLPSQGPALRGLKPVPVVVDDDGIAYAVFAAAP